MFLELQKMLFESMPERRTLLAYQPKVEKQYKVQVFRNHSFELIEHLMNAYLDFAQIGVSFVYSDYDDSFSFLELDLASDMVLIWIDTTRYNVSSVQDFLNGRVEQLRRRYLKPILIVPYGEELEICQSGVTVWNMTEVAEQLGSNFANRRTQAATGTALSGKAMLTISRELGLRYLPAMLYTPLKAVVVDFDNTLYDGVLGEDGIDGLRLTHGHKRLQEELKRLSRQGIFLCAVSKNDRADIQELLNARRDFPLKESSFTKIEASWQEKTDSIQKIVSALNIGLESIVFIDDNIGELTAVHLVLPQVKLIHALEDADVTCEILSYFPGMLRVGQTQEDAIRKVDVTANEDRRILQQELSHEDFIRSLDIRLTFDIQNPEQAVRISELANKTNQFIFNYKRYSQAEVEKLIRSPEYAIVTVSLSDRLSSSGLIGVCVGRQESECVVLEECFISCRALGRGIDDIIVCTAIQCILRQFQQSKLLVRFQKGPRNKPAEDFVQSHLHDFLNAPKEFFYEIPNSLLKIQILNHRRKEG